jgi:hypothetical protein
MSKHPLDHSGENVRVGRIPRFLMIARRKSGEDRGHVMGHAFRSGGGGLCAGVAYLHRGRRDRSLNRPAP